MNTSNEEHTERKNKMSNSIYLMIDEKRTHALCKVGFAKNLQTRINAYTTHNPEVVCWSHMATYDKTGRKIEAAFHAEVEARGYEFTRAIIDNKKTEWFKLDYNDPFWAEIQEKGLKAFTCGAKRKDLGCYVLVK